MQALNLNFLNISVNFSDLISNASNMHLKFIYFLYMESKNNFVGIKSYHVTKINTYKARNFFFVKIGLKLIPYNFLVLTYDSYLFLSLPVYKQNSVIRRNNFNQLKKKFGINYSYNSEIGALSCNFFNFSNYNLNIFKYYTARRSVQYFNSTTGYLKSFFFFEIFLKKFFESKYNK